MPIASFRRRQVSDRDSRGLPPLPNPTRNHGRLLSSASLVTLALALGAPPAAAQAILPQSVSDGTLLQLTDFTIDCSNCVALSAQNPGSTINANGFTLTVGTGGLFTAGAVATGQGTIALVDGTINTLVFAGSQGAQGVISQGAGSLITGDNVNVNAIGFGSSPLVAINGGEIQWTGGTVTMTNNSAQGVIAAWSGGMVTVDGTTFDASQGVELGGGGTVTLTDVDMTTTSFGVYAHQAFSSAPNTFTMTGGSLTAVRPFSAGLVTPSTLATFSLNDAVVTATPSFTGLLRLMDVTSGSTATLNASGSTLSGSIFTDGTSTSTVNLTNGTVWNIQGPENSSVTNLTNNASVIDFAPPAGAPTLLSSYKTLTVNNYVGAGGSIHLNTFLAGDGSPSDRLIIDGGTASGSTPLLARDTGGGGALTTGDGILVVDAVNGTTATGAFGPVLAIAGPIIYLGTRQQGGYAAQQLVSP